MFTRSLTNMRTVMIALAIGAALPSVAGAQTTGLLDRGPILPIVRDANNIPITQQPFGAGFPMWYRDKTGLALVPCFSTTLVPALDGGLPVQICIPAPVGVADPSGYVGNFGDELFYASANATITGTSVSADLVTALEGGYGTGAPVIGQEMVFTRIRIRIGRARNQQGVLVGEIPDGTYRVRHPYGEEILIATGGAGLNFTRDVGPAAGLFDAALGSTDVGPFMRWTTDLATLATGGLVVIGNETFIGNPNILHTITGAAEVPNSTTGPCNCFEIYQVNGNGQADTLLAEQRFFQVVGQVKTGVLMPLPMTVTDATYSRGPVGSDIIGLDVRGMAEPDTTTPQSPAQQMLLSGNMAGVGQFMTYLGNKTWQAHTEYRGPKSAFVSVQNSADPLGVIFNKALVDAVIITRAQFEMETHILHVCAQSSDLQNVGLNASGYGLLDVPSALAGEFCGAFTVAATNGEMLPPLHVSVSSSAGGQGHGDVDIRPLGVAAFATGARATNDAFTMIEDEPLQANRTINVTANDVLTGTDPWTVILVAAPRFGAASVVNNQVIYTPNLNYNGLDGFGYILQNSTGLQTNMAIVTVNITPVNDKPAGLADSASMIAGAPPVVVNVLANDTDPDTVLDPLNVIDAATIRIFTAPNAAVCTISTTAVPGQIQVTGVAAGTCSFKYTVKDMGTQGLRGDVLESDPISVTVLVLGKEALTTTSVIWTTKTSIWSAVKGLSSVASTATNPTIITICNQAIATATCPANLIIGTATASTAGLWALGANVVRPGPIATWVNPLDRKTYRVISLSSNKGGLLSNVIVTIR